MNKIAHRRLVTTTLRYVLIWQCTQRTRNSYLERRGWNSAKRHNLAVRSLAFPIWGKLGLQCKRTVLYLFLTYYVLLVNRFLSAGLKKITCFPRSTLTQICLSATCNWIIQMMVTCDDQAAPYHDTIHWATSKRLSVEVKTVADVNSNDREEVLEYLWGNITELSRIRTNVVQRNSCIRCKYWRDVVYL